MTAKASSFRKALLRGLRDERGNVAMLSALAIVPMLIAGLGAVDVTRGLSAKVQLQNALDAAALAAAKTPGADPALLQATGDRVLRQNLSLASDVVLTSSSFTFGAEGEVLARASIRMSPMVKAFTTGQDLAISAAADVVRSRDKLEIALVLDNTGSMVLGGSNRLAILKTAAKDLVDKLAEAAEQSNETDPIKIALVPFSNTVRVQATTSLASYMPISHTGPGIPSWIDPQGRAHWASGSSNDIFDVANTDRLHMMRNIGVSWAGCVESRRAPFDVQETAPDSSTPATMFTPYFWPDEPDSSSFNDYLTDNAGSGASWMTRQKRTAKYANGPWRNTGNFTSLGMTYQRGPNAGCTLQPLIPLTTNTATVKTAIDNMNAIGETNIPIGMAWGWHALSPNAPLSNGAAYGTPKLRKIVILMTDGENTFYDSGNSNDSNYGGLGFIWQGMLGLAGSSTQGQRSTAMNNRLALLCTNMKARGIEIYTVRVEVQSGSASLLQNCASSPDHFFDVANATDLGEAFDAIADLISNLRVAR